ncbi:heme chaperone HemW [Demequina sediminis]|uniref:Heme chaperone HemW n=1 Tax=Demequina sediminis TaxID=1930058 RepID=A0ABP9WCN4_9MICO|nr:radical SAM family heme chaperone HemW [Demequina sediminis]BDZ60667.1 coproporphyrinogen III oxidase [Demequina sediminis]
MSSASGARDFGVYIHVPFCAVRCGYCDFNTYAPGEVEGATREGYVTAALAEMALARETMRGDGRPARTVFFGGGTPTMLDSAALVALLEGVRGTWGLSADAEVTTEANPDSVTPESLHALARAGFTRVSLGMQSAVPHVLATLERTHRPANVARAVAAAREAGLKVSLDLIYGTPGESLSDWRASLEAVLELEPDHVSAYALVIEPGTRMGAQLRRGEVAPTDPDVQADMYELADTMLSAAGYDWYEVSNWAREPADRCRHNLAYWRSQDWWGIGPGAHSYLGPRVQGDGIAAGASRWWNVKHPRAYAARLAAGESPAAETEPLADEDLRLEQVMLRLRLSEGIPAALVEGRAEAIARLIADGVLDGGAAVRGTLRLTRRGRLLADLAVRALAF